MYISLTLLLTSVIFISANANINEFTITIDPGNEECFYSTVKTNLYLEVDYQVIDGQQGELDIDFHLSSPSGRQIVMESRKSDSTHRTKALEDGDYKFCFDNTFSVFNAKTVFFEISIESDEDDDESDVKNNDVWGSDDKDFYAGLKPEEIYDIQVQDINDSVAKVRGQLTQAQRYQDQIRAFEARDRNMAESNFSRVNFWSIIHLTCLVATGFVQVLMLKSLFDEKSAIRRMWKQSRN